MKRLKLTIAFVLATVGGLFLPIYFVEYYAVLAAVQSAVSGFLAIRNEHSEVRVTELNGKMTRRFREFIASDAKVAVALLQMAIIAQSLAVFHPGHSETSEKVEAQKVECRLAPRNPGVLICSGIALLPPPKRTP